jgi:diguanylate cyclase (GGDEF)-like protein
MHLHDYLRRIPAYLVITLSVFFVIVIGLLDYLTGIELSLDIFLLIPIFLVAWFVSRRAGFDLAVFSAAVWILANFRARSMFVTTFFFDVNVTERLVLFLLIVFLVSALRNSFDHVEQMSRTDSLTELLNARAFYRDATIELERAQRFGRPFTMAYLDADDFKQINDNYGHIAGNDILRLIASVIKRNIRSIDVAGRLGGDEFAILLSETDEIQAREVLARLVSELTQGMLAKSYTSTLSIGAVIVTDFTESVEDIIKLADDTMYSVKNNGKNAIAYKVQ